MTPQSLIASVLFALAVIALVTRGRRAFARRRRRSRREHVRIDLFGTGEVDRERSSTLRPRR